MPVAVITDSTASLPEDFYARYQIVMVPYYLHYGDRAARDMVDIKPAEFNAYLQSLPLSATLPRSANPGPGDYLTAFVSAAEQTREIISFHLSSISSGAYQAALIARDMALQRLHGVRIEVVDTRNVSMCVGWATLQSARAAMQGATLDDILQLVHRLLPVTRMIQTADTLRYLYMGGRIGRAKHLMGSFLNIKPLVTMEDGVIATLGVARTRQGAYQRIATLVEKAVGHGGRIRLALTHAAASSDAQLLKRMVEQVVTPIEVLFCDLSPALALHSGPGTVGLCYMPDIS